MLHSPTEIRIWSQCSFGRLACYSKFRLLALLMSNEGTLYNKVFQIPDSRKYFLVNSGSYALDFGIHPEEFTPIRQVCCKAMFEFFVCPPRFKAIRQCFLADLGPETRRRKFLAPYTSLLTSLTADSQYCTA